MLPMHFGSRDRLLFGIYTPASSPRKRRGALLLNPWGVEAMRAHRSVKYLGDMLARNGVDVFRFDYFGTGDSFGAGEEVTFAGCVDDADMALDELMGVASVRKVCVIGLRFGGLVAGALAERRPREVSQVVFWDPSLSGREILSELRLDGTDGRDETVVRSGFELSPRFREELAGVSLEGLPGTRARVLVARSREADDPQSWGLSAKTVESLSVESPMCWVEERDFGAGAIPVELSRRVTEWVT